MVTNRRMVGNTNGEFYPTPAWGTRALLKYEKFDGNILEGCCGDGSMSKVIGEAGYTVISSDLHDRGYGAVKNFFDITDHYNNVITNPPFNIAEDILEHALSIADNTVCLLLRTAFLESVSRYNKFFKYTDRKPKRVYTFTQRLSMYPAGQKVKGGGTTSYSWFVWDKNSQNTNTELYWIEPGLKE